MDAYIIKVDRCCPNLFGKISIGSNSFLGMRSTIMLGVTIPNNVIVAAGSVVTTSFQEENIIIGGNPAKIIGKWNDFILKNRDFSQSRYDVKKMYIQILNYL